MPRRTRMYLPGMTYHLVQRGNNREPCFFEPENYRHYLDLWKSISRRYRVSVHAYCLMTNHIHFLVTTESETGISNTMKVVGSRYAQYVNFRYRRTGTLWEGRHRSSLVQTSRYLLNCMRYIELNPVRACMVLRPDDYGWSSFIENSRVERGWLAPHAEYLGLGGNSAMRCQAYRELFQGALSERDLTMIRKAAHYNQPIGDDAFQATIEQRYGIKLGQASRGRPRKAAGKLVKK